MYIASWFMLGSITAPLPVRVAISIPQVTIYYPFQRSSWKEGSSSGHLNVMNPECPALSVDQSLYTQCCTSHFWICRPLLLHDGEYIQSTELTILVLYNRNSYSKFSSSTSSHHTFPLLSTNKWFSENIAPHGTWYNWSIAQYVLYTYC